MKYYQMLPSKNIYILQTPNDVVHFVTLWSMMERLAKVAGLIKN